MLHAGEGRSAPGDRRKVPYEILKETGDGASEQDGNSQFSQAR